MLCFNGIVFFIRNTIDALRYNPDKEDNTIDALRYNPDKEDNIIDDGIVFLIRIIA
jgi:hypothetical protein